MVRHRAPIGTRARGHRICRARLYEGGARDHRLWHGHHTAPARRVQCAATRQLCLAARSYRTRGRRPLSGSGHSNVQGDRTVGITEIPTEEFLGRLQTRFGFKPPAAPGHNVVTALEAMIRGEVKVFFAMGGNFAPRYRLANHANSPAKSRSYVHVSTNSTAATWFTDATRDPALSRTDGNRHPGTGPQSITVEDSMSMVHASAGRNSPASEHP